MATKKRKTARAVRANPGLTAAYRRRLDALVDEMSASVEYWLTAAYKANPPKLEVAMDALPSLELGRRIRDLGKRWIKKFDDMAERIATSFVESGRKSTDSAFQSALKDAGFAVEFQVTPVIRDAMNAVIQENVALIKSIPQQYLTDVEGIVMRGFSRGRDLAQISTELQERHGVTKKRAALISIDQSNKLTATVTQARRIELGLFEAEWVHSAAGREPRPDHVKAGNDKLRFDVRKGALISGEYILPGEKIRCRCSSKTILPF